MNHYTVCDRDRPSASVHAETQRVPDRPLDDASAPALGPVRGSEEPMDHVDIETRLVCRNLDLAFHRQTVRCNGV